MLGGKKTERLKTDGSSYLVIPPRLVQAAALRVGTHLGSIAFHFNRKEKESERERAVRIVYHVVRNAPKTSRNRINDSGVTSNIIFV